MASQKSYTAAEISTKALISNARYGVFKNNLVNDQKRPEFKSLLWTHFWLFHRPDGQSSGPSWSRFLQLQDFG